jgi:hypothetical protein
MVPHDEKKEKGCVRRSVRFGCVLLDQGARALARRAGPNWGEIILGTPSAAGAYCILYMCDGANSTKTCLEVRLGWLFATPWRATERVVVRESTAAEALARHAGRAPLFASARHPSRGPCQKRAASSCVCHRQASLSARASRLFEHVRREEQEPHRMHHACSTDVGGSPVAVPLHYVDLSYPPVVSCRVVS